MIADLIAAHTTGDRTSLVALGEALAQALVDTPTQPADPSAVWAAGETAGTETGTWADVRAARDYGDLTDAEYAYLTAAVEHHTTGGTS